MDVPWRGKGGGGPEAVIEAVYDRRRMLGGTTGIGGAVSDT